MGRGWGGGDTAGCHYFQPVGSPQSQRLPEGPGPRCGVGVPDGNTVSSSCLIWARDPLPFGAVAPFTVGVRGVLSAVCALLCFVGLWLRGERGLSRVPKDQELLDPGGPWARAERVFRAPTCIPHWASGGQS